jgi:amino acid transporter
VGIAAAARVADELITAPGCCYDGAGPRVLGVINAKYGTPVRVNVFSGIVATVVAVLAHQISSGSDAKYFDAVLGVTISTTLISYLLIYPVLWKLRRSHPATPPAVQGALGPAADRDPDASGRRGQHPAHRPPAGQLVVRQ